ncbi:GntR family transcriptional regulator, partial [Klebsiella pneumoniae]
MSNFGLQQNTSVPLYRQLKDKILSDISSGKLAEGEKIPTEIELSELYNISRITVRNAVKELVAEGYLVKKQGKGTFVCLPKIERKVVHLLREGANKQVISSQADSLIKISRIWA